MNHFLNSKLKNARELLRLTQQEAASLSGLSQRDISLIENGKRSFIPTSYITFFFENGVDINSLYDPSIEVKKSTVPGNISNGEIVLQHNHPNIIPFVNHDDLPSNLVLTPDHIQFYFTLPGFIADFITEIKSKEMFPSYHNHDLGVFKVTELSTFNQWGSDCLISVKKEGVKICSLLEGKDADHIRLNFKNSAYPSEEIARRQLDGIALLTGIIRSINADAAK